MKSGSDSHVNQLNPWKIPYKSYKSVKSMENPMTSAEIARFSAPPKPPTLEDTEVPWRLDASGRGEH